MRVLMLGWELFPRISGGLGTACQGLLEGLVGRGAEVLFVLPRARGDEASGGARVVGTEELLARAGLLDERARVALLPLLSDGPASPYLQYAFGRTAGAGGDAAGDARAYSAYGPGLAREVARFARAAGEAALREPFDVIHAHDWMTWPAGVAARAVSGRPLVCHVHATEFDRSGARPDPAIVAIERAGLAAADRVVCVSRYEAGVVEERYGIDPRAMRVVHNAVRPVAPSAEEPKSREPLVLFVGRVTAQKDPATFLAAAARVAARMPAARFVVAGDGDLLGPMVELALALGLGPRVRFTGFLEPADVARLYRRAHVYVLPSLSEPFGIAPLEAAHAGLPVIVSRKSGVVETLPCLTFEPGDVEGLADKVLALLRRPALCESMRGEAHAALAEMSWERAAGEVLSVYRELAA